MRAHALRTAFCIATDATASAKLHGLEPEGYLRDLLRVLPHWPRDRYLELAPLYWAETRARIDDAELERELGPLTVPAVPASRGERPAAERPSAD
jgi:hypothetical protein